jgi:hypothetical protein
MSNLKKNFINSGNKKIDSIIQEMQLKINKYDDIVFEWISYGQFKDVEKMSKDDFTTIYSAIWKDGPLCYKKQRDMGKYARSPDKKVALKYSRNLQNIDNEFSNKV